MKLSLKYFVYKNIKNLFLVFIALALINVLLVISIWPTIVNMFANYELDYQEAFVEKNLMDIIGQGGDSYNFGERFNIEVQNMIDYANTYKQNDKYKFKIKPVDVYDLEIYCETTYEFTSYNMLPKRETVTSYKIILLDTGNAYIFARVKPEFEVIPSKKYIGVFVPLTKMLADTVKNELGEGNYLRNVFVYELDTLNSFSFYRFTDLAFVLIPFVIFIVVGIKLFIYIRDYRKHPTYRSLENLPNEPHENEELINLELADINNLFISKNVYKTKGWIITKGFLKTKVSRIAKGIKFDD
mgnify:CR=1 FL=1